MSKLASKLSLALFLSIILSQFAIAAGVPKQQSSSPSPPAILGKSAIVIDSKTGQIIYSKKPYESHYPASTTKIVTALLTLEHLKLNKIVTPSQKACAITGDSSTAGIMCGEKLSVINLLYALLLDSANECANILAEQVGGSIDNFAAMMNKKVKSLGGVNSNFVNPHGYHDKDHHTCAYDLSRVAMEAIKYPLFRKIVSTPIYKIPPTNKHPKGIYLSNTNRLINRYRGMTYFYPYAAGIKTGYTSQANHTLVSLAKKGNLEFICVILDSNNTFGDAIKLFNYSFSNYKKIIMTRKSTVLGTKKLKNAKIPLTAIASKDLNYLVPISSKAISQVKIEYKNELTFPIKKDSVVGYAIYSVNGKSIGKVPLCAKETVEEISMVKKITCSKGFRGFVSISKVISLLCILAFLSCISLIVWKHNSQKKMWFKRK